FRNERRFLSETCRLGRIPPVAAEHAPLSGPVGISRFIECESVGGCKAQDRRQHQRINCSTMTHASLPVSTLSPAAQVSNFAVILSRTIWNGKLTAASLPAG